MSVREDEPEEERLLYLMQEFNLCKQCLICISCSKCILSCCLATTEVNIKPFNIYPINSGKGVPCVNRSTFVHPVTNVHTAVPNLSVGARLHQFGET